MGPAARRGSHTPRLRKPEPTALPSLTATLEVSEIRRCGRRFDWLQCCFNWVLMGVICASRVPVTAVVSRVGCLAGSLPFTEFLHELTPSPMGMRLLSPGDRRRSRH